MKIFLTCIAMCIFLLSIANAEPTPYPPQENLSMTQNDLMASLPKMIEIARPDGSLQCGGGNVILLDEERERLEEGGVSVQGARRRHDGLKRIAMCGAPTGQVLVFEIAITDLEKAEALGYQRVTYSRS